MFTGGALNLPPISASGIDPHWLAELPFDVRHHAADLATEAEVHALFEQCLSNPTARIDHPGLDAAGARMRAWAHGTAPEATKTVTRASTSTRPESQGTGGEQAVQHLTPQALIELSKRGQLLPKAVRQPRPVATPRPAAATPAQPQRPTAQPGQAGDADRIYEAAGPTTNGA